MLLREIQVLLKTHSRRLSVASEDLSGGRHNFMNRDELRHSLDALASIDFLHHMANDARARAAFHVPTTVVDSRAIKDLEGAVSSLSAAAMIVGGFLETVLPPPDGFYVSVKIPAKFDSNAESVAKSINAIHVALDQPVRQLGFGPLRISVLQPGSKWAELVHDLAPAMTAIGGIIAIAIAGIKLQESKALRDAAQIKVQEELAKLEQEKFKADAEALRVRQEMLKKEMQQLEFAAREAEIKERLQSLQTERRIAELIASGNGTAETEAVLRNCIAVAEEFVRDGSEFRLQLDAPQEIAESFPPEALPDRFGVPPKKLASTTAPKQLPP